MKEKFNKSLRQLDLEDLATKFDLEAKGHTTVEINGRKRTLKINSVHVLFVGTSFGQNYYTTVSGTSDRHIQQAYRNIKRQSLKKIGKYHITDMMMQNPNTKVWSRVAFQQT